jgi:serine/threonine protein kinase
MAVLYKVSVLALRRLVEGVVKAVGFKTVEGTADALVAMLGRHFADHSQRLTTALATANERAWKALEISLAGDSWWQRCKLKLAAREYQAFREQVQAFLAAAPLAGLPGQDAGFTQQALRELQAARKAGALTGGSLVPEELARRAGAFARFADPAKVLDAEWQLVDEVVEEIRGAGFAALGSFLALRPPKGEPLLVTAVRYFFRREAETDRQLFQGLAFAQMERLAQAEESAFAALAEALAQQGQRLEELLGDVFEVVTQTHGEVLNIRAELGQLGPQIQELGQAVLAALEQHRLAGRAVRADDSLSIHSPAERQLVRRLVARYRALPEPEQRRLPALLNGLGMLEIAAGEVEEAQRDFERAAELTPGPRARAEAEYNVYQAALERCDWAAALEAFRHAVSLDPERFAPFPTAKYEVEKILGTGGFGVAFLCRNRHSNSRVVVKALRAEGLERSVADLFREAQVLEELDHPAIIRLRDCDFADPGQSRPFVVMDYFDGPTLADHVARHGPLPADDLLELACPMAEALHAAHECGILHRDVKPANVLVRKDGAAWRVKLIDFGLALKQSVLRATIATPAAKSRVGYSIVGTVDFAAPEQMGRHPGVAAGPPADVYGFGKTCWYALFQTTQPLMKHWRSLPAPLAELLEDCLADAPAGRPAGFAEVLRRLTALRSDKPRPEPERREAPAAPAPASLPPRAAEPPARVGFVEVRRFVGHGDMVWGVAFSPDGTRLLSASGNIFSGSKDYSVRLWQADTGAEVRRFQAHTDGVLCVAFSPDGRHALSGGGDSTVRLWDVETGKEVRRFPWHMKRVWSVTFSPDGRRLASGSWDQTVRVWEADTGREVCRFEGHTNGVNSVAFSPDGRHVLSGSTDQTIRLWDVGSCKEVGRFTGHTDYVTRVLFSPDGRRVLSAGKDQTLRLWDLATGKELHRFTGHGNVIYAAAFFPDGRRVLSGSWDQTMRLWDAAGGRELACVEGHPQGVNCVAVSPDGHRLASGCRDHLVRLWEATD